MQKLKKFYLKNEKWISFLFANVLIFIVGLLWMLYFKQYKIIFCFVFVAFVCNAIYFFKKDFFYKCLDTILKYRYLFALIIFLLCVCFKINGSSMGIYNIYFPEDNMNHYTDVYFGISRDIRSDEYIVQTPYYFSQYYNHFNRNSHFMSMSGQDMIIGYNSPVLDISIIAKPLVWGYVLFGPSYGISWYWCLKIILFILIMYELVMILTKKNKILSVLGSLLITFAPVIQWFFNPHLSDVFLWGMGLVVLGYHFFTTKKKWLKNLTILLLPLQAICFVLALYPPLQVPVGILAICLLVFFLIRDKEEIQFQKKDIFTIAFMFLISIGVILYEVLMSKDAILLLMHTAYPGTRLELGGNFVINDIFTDLTNLFLPYRGVTYSNPCELSDFMHFGPICLIVFILISKKLKEMDKEDYLLGLGFMIVLIVEIVFMLVGFPKLLSKITLFSYINRMKPVYGFTSVLFTLYLFSVYLKHKDLLSKKQIKIILITFFISYLFLITDQELTYLPWFMYVLEILLFTVLLGCLLFKKTYLSYILVLFIVILSGFAINPIRVGIRAITDHELVTEVKKLKIEDDSYILTTDNIVVGSLLMANGIKVINTVNYYPDFDKWNILDPSQENMDYYNRYSHEEIEIVDEETSFNLIAPDCIGLKLNLLDIQKLPVSYVVTTKEIEDLKNYSNSHLKFVKEIKGIRLYEMVR